MSDCTECVSHGGQFMCNNADKNDIRQKTSHYKGNTYRHRQ